VTFNTASFLVQVAALVVVLVALHKPLGVYLVRVFEGKTSSRPERLFYRLAGIDAGTEQTWPVYLRSVLAFSAVSILLVFVLQRLQGVLPGSGSLPGVDPWVAMNTAISFVTNTNWQTYAPETTVGIFVQMTLLAVQNFLSAAVGIVVVVALIRGIARTRPHPSRFIRTSSPHAYRAERSRRRDTDDPSPIRTRPISAGSAARQPPGSRKDRR